eukprot:g26721.t1
MSLTRREFLQAGVGTVVGSTVFPHLAVAAKPQSHLHAPFLKMRLSLAAYSMRKFMQQNWPTPRKRKLNADLTMTQFVDYCAKLELDGCELTSYFFPKSIDDAYLSKLRIHALWNRLDISGTAIGNDFCVKEGNAREKQLRMCRQWIDYAAVMGAPAIRIFAGRVPKGDNEAAAIERCVAGINTSLDYAAQKGVGLALENHGGITSTPQQMLRIIEGVKDSPWFGVNFDSGNFRTDDPYRDLEMIAPYAINAQVKVAVTRKGKKEHADLKRTMKILSDAGYRGWVALEYEESEDPYKAIPRYAVDFDLITRLIDSRAAVEAPGETPADRARRAQSPTNLVRLPENDGDRAVRREASQYGEQLISAGKVGAMLVAGGQGSRLGFPHAKGKYPIGPVSERTLYQVLAEQLLARSRRAGISIPYYVMTSAATHDETIDFFETNAFFGLNPADVHFFQQASMPAVDATTGRLLLEDKGRLALSPDGHGGMLAALAAAGLLDDMRNRGVEYLYYHQVDNPTAIICDPEILGLHAVRKSEMSTKVVAKKSPTEKMGVVVDVDGQTQIIEYSDLPEEIAGKTDEDGRPLFWAGNMAIHVFDRAFLERMAAESDALPYHVAHKKVEFLDDDGNAVAPDSENAFKFERFIFDALPHATSALVVEADREREFNPVKNKEGNDSPKTAKAALNAVYAAWLRHAGAEVVDGIDLEISPLYANDSDGVARRVQPGTRVEETRRQLPALDAENVLVEPCGRNTAPCIGLAAIRLLHDDPDATMLVMPADHVIQPADVFRRAAESAAAFLESHADSFVLFGVPPTYPATGFGYIERGETVPSAEGFSKVNSFREKPDLETAGQYVEAGTFLWNCGIFVWRADAVLKALEQFEPEIHTRLLRMAASIGGDRWSDVLADEFPEMKKISIDYAVLERASDVVVVEAPFGWDDVGSWESLPRLLGADDAGNTVDGLHAGLKTSGCIIRSTDETHLIATHGIENLIVVHTPDATIVARKADENAIREIVEQLEKDGHGRFL